MDLHIKISEVVFMRHSADARHSGSRKGQPGNILAGWE